jgi:thioredoxin reductase
MVLGTPPATFRNLAREQILKYDTATIEDDTVESIDPIEGGDFTSFNVKITNGTTYTARKIVLGTGVVDLLADTPGLKEGFGKGIWWCPWCDGFEHRDQQLGMIGDITDMLSDVLEVHTLYSDMIAFVNGTQTPEGEARAAAKVSDWKEQLEAWGTKIDNRTIASIERLQDGGKNRSETEHAQYDKFRVHFTTGEPVERSAFMVNVPTAQYSSLPAQMGLEMAGAKINVTSGMRTSQSGVFAVGDANSDGSTNVPHAMFSGKKAAVYVHGKFHREIQSPISNRPDYS